MHELLEIEYMGVKKAIARVASKIYWEKMRETITNYVHQCKKRQKCKSLNHKPFGLLQRLEPPAEKWTHTTMDLIEPLPRSEKEKIGVLMVVDRLSKMIHVLPFSKDPSAVQATHFFLDYIYK